MTATKVPVVARLRLPDGREFDVHSDIDESHVPGMYSYWDMGNNSCDCNRSLYLNREHGLNLGVRELGDEFCMPCGYTISLVSLKVGGKDALELVPEDER